MPGPAFTTGDTVSLHPIEPEDYEFIQRGRNDPDVRVPLTDTTIRTLDDVEAMLEDEEYHFLICVPEQPEGTNEASSEGRSPSDHSSGRSPREDGEGRPANDANDDPEPVGVVAFGYVSGSDERGSLMYWVAPEHQGNGYVSEATELLLDYAFAEVGFHKVTARVNVSNEASAAVLESLGFVQEGRRRKESVVDGEYEDMFTYGLLADEWLN